MRNGRKAIKKAFFGLVFGIGLATILVGGYRVLWPVIDAKGVVTTGEYRGIRIGEARVDVELDLIIPGLQRLKLFGYVDDNGRLTPITSPSYSAAALEEAEVWLLNYPGIHKESVKLTFLDDRVVRIEYERDALSP